MQNPVFEMAEDLDQQAGERRDTVRNSVQENQTSEFDVRRVMRNTQSLNDNPFEIAKSAKSQNAVNIEDFQIVRKLGQGAYGKVYLGEKDGQSYAIKKLSKDFLIKT